MLKLLGDGIAATPSPRLPIRGLRVGELRGLRWEDYEPPADANSLGSIHVERSIWRSTVNQPKTEKSKGLVPVIPALAERLDRHRMAQGSPASGPIFANGAGKALDLDSLHWRQMRTCFGRRESAGKAGMDSAAVLRRTSTAWASTTRSSRASSDTRTWVLRSVSTSRPPLRKQ